MKREKVQRNFVEGVAAFFILLFVYTGISKLLAPQTFTHFLSQALVVKAAPRLFAKLIPGVELLIACTLLFRQTKELGLIASAASMLTFSCFIGCSLIFEKKLACSCGGIISTLGWKSHLVFNLVCLALASIALLFSRQEKLIYHQT